MSYLTISRRNMLVGGGVLALSAPAILSSTTSTFAASGSNLPMRAVARFSLGDMKLTVIDDQLFTVPTAIFGANAPEGSVDKLLGQYGLAPEFAEMQGQVLLIESGDAKILVDTGQGDITLPDAPVDNGRLFAGLKAVGVNAEDITHVILTHGHFDHIGGVTTDGIPNFPNAKHYMSAADLKYWTAKPGNEANFENLMISMANGKLNPIKSMITTVSDGDEIISGVKVLAAPGHTVGHLAVQIKSGDESLLHLVDTSVHYLVGTNEPEWALGIEHDPQAAIATRRKLFRKAVEENLLVAGYHFPFPGVGRLSANGDAFLYTPVSIS